MPSDHASVVRLGLIALLALTLAGCAGHSRRDDTWAQHFGIRPDEPRVETGADSCAVYAQHATYAQQLQEAYHSRASQNRFWIYAAGIVGLGAAAAAGGLGAAAAAATTIALVSVSGGFAAGTFAAINNSDLAKIYTIAANKIDTTLLEADHVLQAPPGHNCVAALRVLKDGVSEARVMLEQARTDNAVGALIRAKEEQKILVKLAESIEEANPTRVTMPSSITDVQPNPLPPLGAATTRDVTLTVENIQLDRVAQSDVKVVIGGGDPIPVTTVTRGPKEFSYVVTFRAPDNRPDPAQASYPVMLLVGKSRQRVVATKALTYP
jgi:hypothetical protein